MLQERHSYNLQWKTNRKSYVACNFSSHIKTVGLIQGHRQLLHCKDGNILERVQDKYVVTNRK